MTLFLIICAAAVLVYVGFCLAVYFNQSSYVYHPDRDVTETPLTVGLNYREVFIETDDGEKICAWHVPADGKAHVLFCHGNGGDMGDCVGSVKAFNSLGLDVLIFDYRGYGKSSGKPDEKGTYSDAEAAWNFLLREFGVLPSKIVVYGKSLGGAVAAWLGERKNPGCLVLDSSLSSAPDMARDMFPLLPVGLICGFSYDAAGTVRRVKCPVLVAHSPNDETVGIHQGRKVFESANEPKEFVEFRGSHDAGGIEDDERYRVLFVDFLLKYGILI